MISERGCLADSFVVFILYVTIVDSSGLAQPHCLAASLGVTMKSKGTERESSSC